MPQANILAGLLLLGMHKGGTQLEVVRVLGGPPGLETLVPVPGHDPLLGGHSAKVHAFQPWQRVDDVRPASGNDTAA